MISCSDLYTISSRFLKLPIHDKPFGGISVILVGDFAQLDPPRGPSLYSGSVLGPSKLQRTNEHHWKAYI